jgi:CheY-like chemotaxis protein
MRRLPDMKRILVVDDDAASREAARDILTKLGCAVETAVDACGALDRLQSELPDVVLVGLNIADMAGGAFVCACHQDSRCSGVPVVVMAATPRAAVNAIRLGARGCIRKPVDTGRLVSGLLPYLPERDAPATSGPPSTTRRRTATT